MCRCRVLAAQRSRGRRNHNTSEDRAIAPSFCWATPRTGASPNRSSGTGPPRHRSQAARRAAPEDTPRFDSSASQTALAIADEALRLAYLVGAARHDELSYDGADVAERQKMKVVVDEE